MTCQELFLISDSSWFADQPQYPRNSLNLFGPALVFTLLITSGALVRKSLSVKWLVFTFEIDLSLCSMKTLSRSTGPPRISLSKLVIWLLDLLPIDDKNFETVKSVGWFTIKPKAPLLSCSHKYINVLEKKSPGTFSIKYRNLFLKDFIKIAYL